MSRYTGASYRKSRRLGFSILHQDYMVKKELKNYLTMVFNCKKNKKLDLCMV